MTFKNEVFEKMFYGKVKIGNMIYTLADKSLPIEGLTYEYDEDVRFGIEDIGSEYGGEFTFHSFYGDSDYKHHKGCKLYYRGMVKDGDYIVIQASTDEGGVLPIKFKIEEENRMCPHTELLEILRRSGLYLDGDDLDALKEKISIAKKRERNGEIERVKLTIDIITKNN